MEKVFKNSNIRVEKSKATFELLIDEFESVIVFKRLTQTASPLAKMFGLEEVASYMNKKFEKQSDKILNRLIERSPEIKKKWETIKLTEDRIKRRMMSKEPELMRTDFYCSKYSGGRAKTTCSDQCFDCIADIGERKLKK